MVRGFLGGVFVGGVVSVMGAGVASIVNGPMVVPEASDQSPEIAAAPAPGDSAAPVAATEADVVRDSATPVVTAPEADNLSAAQSASADTPNVPETGTPEELAGPAAVTGSTPVEVDPEAPVLPNPQAALTTQPGVETALAAPADPNPAPTPDPAPAPDLPEGDEIVAPAAPEAPAAAPEAPEAEEPAPAAPPVAVPEAPQTPELAPEEDTQAAQAPSARPSIGRPATSIINRANEAAAEPEAADAPLPPIEAFAVPFENPQAKPLMSIILIDTGADLTSGPVGLAALRSFPYPLTFAVDAMAENAAERAADYRAQGFEVLALVDLPAGATATDAEVTLQASLEAVPEAVGVIEGTGTGLQEGREASDQVTEALLASGHGMVLQSKGLNTMHKLAAREGMPTGLIFRDFDSADQTPTVIRRFLDQAAFRASQEGAVIMVGRLRPDTISALLLWGLQDRAQRVALAPVSGVLQSLAGQGGE